MVGVREKQDLNHSSTNLPPRQSRAERPSPATGGGGGVRAWVRAGGGRRLPWGTRPALRDLRPGVVDFQDL